MRTQRIISQSIFLFQYVHHIIHAFPTYKSHTSSIKILVPPTSTLTTAVASKNDVNSIYKTELFHRRQHQHKGTAEMDSTTEMRYSTKVSASNHNHHHPTHHHHRRRQGSVIPNKKRILSAIDSAIEAQEEQAKYDQYYHNHQRNHHHQQQRQEHRRMGLLGTPIEEDVLSPLQNPSRPTQNDIYYDDQHTIHHHPKPGSILIPQKAKLTKSTYLTNTSTNSPTRLKDHISIHVGKPSDDTDIANLRLSVFNDYTIVNQHQIEDWVYRSSCIIRQRRLKGAMTLNAFLNYVDDRNTGRNSRNDVVQNWMVGSLECSTHEFIGTELGTSRPPGSLLYITEVAVSPKIRRSGTATMLLQALDTYAKQYPNIETIYLHVDVENFAAYSLYKRAGFEVIDSHHNRMYAEFTRKLNLHDGATRGRNHHLMQKKIRREQTWYSYHQRCHDNHVNTSGRRQQGRDNQQSRGKIGFEFWDFEYR